MLSLNDKSLVLWQLSDSYSERDIESGLMVERIPCQVSEMDFMLAIGNNENSSTLMDTEKKNASVAILKEGSDKCHNSEALSGSHGLITAALNKWPWEEFSPRVYRDYITSSQCEKSEAKCLVINVEDVRKWIADVQCNNCKENLGRALSSILEAPDLCIHKKIKLHVQDNKSEFVLSEVITHDVLAILLHKVRTVTGVSKDKIIQNGTVPESCDVNANETCPQSLNALRLCLENPSCTLRPDDSSIYIEEGLHILLEKMDDCQLSTLKYRDAVQTNIAWSDSEGDTLCTGIEWNPHFAQLILPADKAVSAWLQQITAVVIAVGNIKNFAFLSSEELQTSAVLSLSEHLTNSYENALSRLLTVIFESQDEQLNLSPQPAMMALFIAGNLRRAIVRTLNAKCKIISELHKSVQNMLSSAPTRILLRNIEILRARWENPLLGSKFIELDILLKDMFSMRLQLFSGDSGGTSANQPDSLVVAQQLDVQLSRMIAEWEERLEKFKEWILQEGDLELSPYLYPQTPAMTKALQDWKSEFVAEWEDIEQKKLFQSHASQNKVTAYNEQFVRVKQQLKIINDSKEALARERKQHSKTDLAQSDINDFMLKLSWKQNELTEKTQVLGLERQLAHQRQISTRLTYRLFMIRQLQQKYWHCQEYYIKVECLIAGRPQKIKNLCGGLLDAENRLSAIIAVCALESVRSSCCSWAAERMEQQLLQEVEVQAETQSRRKNNQNKPSKTPRKSNIKSNRTKQVLRTTHCTRAASPTSSSIKEGNSVEPEILPNFKNEKDATKNANYSQPILTADLDSTGFVTISRRERNRKKVETASATIKESRNVKNSVPIYDSKPKKAGEPTEIQAICDETVTLHDDISQNWPALPAMSSNISDLTTIPISLPVKISRPSRKLGSITRQSLKPADVNQSQDYATVASKAVAPEVEVPSPLAISTSNAMEQDMLAPEQEMCRNNSSNNSNCSTVSESNSKIEVEPKCMLDSLADKKIDAVCINGIAVEFGKLDVNISREESNSYLSESVGSLDPNHIDESNKKSGEYSPAKTCTYNELEMDNIQLERNNQNGSAFQQNSMNGSDYNMQNMNMHTPYPIAHQQFSSPYGEHFSSPIFGGIVQHGGHIPLPPQYNVPNVPLYPPQFGYVSQYVPLHGPIENRHFVPPFVPPTFMGANMQPGSYVAHAPNNQLIGSIPMLHAGFIPQPYSGYFYPTVPGYYSHPSYMNTYPHNNMHQYGISTGFEEMTRDVHLHPDNDSSMYELDKVQHRQKRSNKSGHRKESVQKDCIPQKEMNGCNVSDAASEVGS